MDLYQIPPSPFCRSVFLTLKALGIEDVNRIDVDILQCEQLKEEFVAINPQHCLPTIVDGDLTLWESSAINQYLVNKNAEDDTLYPKDPKVRARLDRLICFNGGTLMTRFGKYVYPVLMESGGADEEALEKAKEALAWLNADLADTEYAVGDAITIADFALVSTVSTIQECGIDLSEYENITAWLERCQENIVGYEEENLAGAKMFGEMFKSKLE